MDLPEVSEKRMNLLPLLRSRFTIRAFKPGTTVSEEGLAAVLEAGRIAPSAKNTQPVYLYLIKNGELLESMKSGGICETYNAPLMIVVCIVKENQRDDEYHELNSEETDAAIVTDHMMLTAHSLGIGTAWVCDFYPDKLIEKLKIPSGRIPINLLLLGYPQADCKPSVFHSQKRAMQDFCEVIE